MENKFYIKDSEKNILIEMEQKKYLGWHHDAEGTIIDEEDDNLIEFFYGQTDDGGSGCGDGVYISTVDIKGIADCIRSVINQRESFSEYHTSNDLIRISIGYNAENDRYTFGIAMLEMLCGEYHITITKDDLTISELNAYIDPFFEWEKQYPIINVSE